MKAFPIILVSAVSLLAAGCACNGGNKGSGTDGDGAIDSTAVISTSMNISEKLAAMPAEPIFDIVTSLGTIKVKLYADTPKHRENFAKLALSGFYDGTLFHRVIADFMIQAGDPLTKQLENRDRFGYGGPGYQIPAEIVPGHHHKKGALAAARKGDMANPMKESSGSQFYIVQSETGCAHLDGEYTIFGETIEGFEVIDAIASVPTDFRGLPASPIHIKSIQYNQEENEFGTPLAKESVE